MNQGSLNPDNPYFHNIIGRNYRIVRECPAYTLEEALSFSYIESLTFTRFTYNRIFLKTELFQNYEAFPKLAKFFFDLKNNTLALNEFVSVLDEEMETEIKLFGRMFIGRDMESIMDFSKKFNVRVLHFDDWREVLDVNECQYFNPVKVALMSRYMRPYLLYLSNENNEVVECEYSGIPSQVLQIFNDFGKTLSQIIENNGSELDKADFIAALSRLKERKDIEWTF